MSTTITNNTTTLDLDHATDALETLSAEHRQSIHLTYYSGFTQTQVADLLGVPVDTIETRLRDGMSSLKKAMAKAA